MSSKHPVLFLSHGSPMLALDPGRPGAWMRVLGRHLEQPRAILVASAHWGTTSPEIGAADSPQTIHDFGGFPPPLYALQYAAPGAPAIAARVTELLLAAGIVAVPEERMGLDHGAWVPLRYLFPAANVPVLQLSIQPHRDARHHYALGRALEPLSAEGVLVMGSGGISHNLREYRPQLEPEPAPDWMRDFIAWMADATARQDVDSLLDYRALAPDAVRNHPTDEHLLPFFVALGAAGRQRGRRHTHGNSYGLLAMDSYSWGLTEMQAREVALSPGVDAS